MLYTFCNKYLYGTCCRCNYIMVPKSERLRVLHLHMRAHASHDSCDDSSDAKYGMITTPHSTTQWLSNMLMLSYTVQSWAVD